MTTYFGFAIASSMFPSEGVLIKPSKVNQGDVVSSVQEAIPCLNPSHAATIAAMQERFGIYVEIPESPPKVSLGVGDSIIVMSVRGLPRLTDRREYSHKEIESAVFEFVRYDVLDYYWMTN